MKPVLIAWSRQGKQLWPGAGDSLTAFVKMDIGSGYAAVLRYGSRRMRTSVSMSESTKQGSKSADLVQILAVCTNAARSTEAGQLRILISALSAWAAAVEPFMAAGHREITARNPGYPHLQRANQSGLAYLKLGTAIYRHRGLGGVHGGAVKIGAAPFEILAVPPSVRRMQARRPYFLQSEPSVQCRDRPNAGWGRNCWTETSNRWWPRFLRT